MSLFLQISGAIGWVILLLATLSYKVLPAMTGIPVPNDCTVVEEIVSTEGMVGL